MRTQASYTGCFPEPPQLRVWDLESLRHETTLLLPVGQREGICALATGHGCVWAGVGEDVAVWGHGHGNDDSGDGAHGQ